MDDIMNQTQVHYRHTGLHWALTASRNKMSYKRLIGMKMNRSRALTHSIRVPSEGVLCPVMMTRVAPTPRPSADVIRSGQRCASHELSEVSERDILPSCGSCYLNSSEHKQENNGRLSDRNLNF